MTRRARIRRLAEQLIREGEARWWAEAYELAARRVRDETHAGGPPAELTEEALEEAANNLFTNDPIPRPPAEVEDVALEEASRRLFGEGEGRNPNDLSESFADRSRGGG